jgi:hypothetical protein
MYSLEYLKKKINANKNIKLREVRMLKRIMDNLDGAHKHFLLFGEVWISPDKNIIFDGRQRNIKVVRPVLIIEKEKEITPYGSVRIAPGTSKARKITPTVLMAKVPPEALDKTTFFLLHLSQYTLIKELKTKKAELSPDLKKTLIKLLKK